MPRSLTPACKQPGGVLTTCSKAKNLTLMLKTMLCSQLKITKTDIFIMEMLSRNHCLKIDRRTNSILVHVTENMYTYKK